MSTGFMRLQAQATGMCAYEHLGGLTLLIFIKVGNARTALLAETSTIRSVPAAGTWDEASFEHLPI